MKLNWLSLITGILLSFAICAMCLALGLITAPIGSNVVTFIISFVYWRYDPFLVEKEKK